MLRHLKPGQGETGSKKDNPFNDIRELPRWQMIAEVIGYAAGFLVVIEFLVRFVGYLAS